MSLFAERQSENGEVRVFESPWLERLTHVHPITPLLLWAPVSIWLIFHSIVGLRIGVGSVLGLGALALLVWSLTEYWLHRLVFHLRWDTPSGKQLQFLIHGLHHDDPNDKTRLVMPPFGSLVLAAILYTTFRAVLGPIWVQPFFAFFVIGYLIYDYTHFAVHHFNPRTEIGKRIKRHHMMHHFVNPNAGYGVSCPIWDYVFGTTEEALASSHRVAHKVTGKA